MQESAVSKTEKVVWDVNIMKNTLFIKQLFFIIMTCLLFTFLLRISIEHSTEIYGIVAYFGICAIFGFIMGNALNFLEERNYYRYKYKTLEIVYMVKKSVHNPKG